VDNFTPSVNLDALMKAVQYYQEKEQEDDPSSPYRCVFTAAFRLIGYSILKKGRGTSSKLRTWYMMYNFFVPRVAKFSPCPLKEIIA
jgi:hypothetical protein